MENDAPAPEQKKRGNPRYHSKARAYIINVLENAIVKDISTTGCCLVCEQHFEITLYEKYVIHILPEGVNNIGKFEVLAESRWIRSGDDSCEIGFFIISSPMLFAQ